MSVTSSTIDPVTHSSYLDYFSVWRVLNKDIPPVKVMCIYALHKCLCVFQVSCPVLTVTPPPFLKREEEVWAQRPHPLTQTLTCPSEELMSIQKPAGLCERSRTWQNQYQWQWLPIKPRMSWLTFDLLYDCPCAFSLESTDCQTHALWSHN